MKRSVLIWSLICTLIVALGLPAFAQEEEILGVWVNAGKIPVYEFVAGFKPDSGVAVEYKNGEVESVDTWSIEGAEIKIGYSTYALSIENGVLKLDEQVYSKSEDAPFQELVGSVKDSPDAFVEPLTQSSWIVVEYPDRVYRFMKGFTDQSGVYSYFKGEELSELEPWIIENDVLKVSSTVYPNAKILTDYLVILDSYDNLNLLRRGEAFEEAASTDLVEERDKFIELFTKGAWQTPYYLYEYRPTFGDLSGSAFVYDAADNTYKYAEDWEYSIETGILKWAYREYVAGRVIGKYLLLQEDDGETRQFIRSADSSAERETHSSSKQLVISERELDNLKSVLARQWYRRPYHYIMEFDPAKPQGYLHEFRSLPFVIEGNSIDIEDITDVEAVWQWKDKIILGQNNFSMQADAEPVLMAPVDAETAAAKSEEQAAAMEEMQQETMVLVIELADGQTVTVPIPVENLSTVKSIRIQPK